MDYVVIDECPCPKRLYPILRKLKRETGCVFNSLYRGNDAAIILHRYGKHTQAELYRMGYPANPPGIGTHVLRGDGTVGAYGQKLPWWRCGIDVNDSDVEALIRAAKRHGWVLYQPYSSPSEFHHLNFAKKPTGWRAFFRRVFGRRR